MKNPFELLEAAEEYARQSAAHLETLKEMELEEGEAARLADLIKKGAKIDEAILDQKARLLGSLIRIAYPLADKAYKGNFPGICHYVLAGPNEIKVVLNHESDRRRSSNHLLGYYTPEKFVRTEYLWWRHFCEAIIKRLEWHVVNDAEAHKALANELVKVLSRFRELIEKAS